MEVNSLVWEQDETLKGIFYLFIKNLQRHTYISLEKTVILKSKMLHERIEKWSRIIWMGTKEKSCDVTTTSYIYEG